MRKLRDYQTQAVAHLHAGWATGLTRIPMVLATGLGKTEIFTDPTLLDPTLDAGRRVLIVAHTDELIEQAAKKARRNNPSRRVGIVKAAENQTTAEIVVSSRQTLQSARRREQIRNVGLIIIDEAHHALRTNTYGHILEHFGAFHEGCGECATKGCQNGVKVAGFTATLARGDKGKLSSVWQHGADVPIFRRDILFGIRRGYLLDVTGERVVVPEMDLSRVRVRGGDYSDRDLGDELERTFAPEIVAKEYARICVYGPDGAVLTQYRKGIAFWPLVDTAYAGAKAFNEAGIRSEVIHGELPKLERRALLARLHSGETQVVHGVGVLTEGFDEPTVDVCVIARPTRSAPLYQQMVGRVLRPNLELPSEARGKALILDVVGAGATHDLRSLIDLAPERPLRRDAENEDASLLELEDQWLEEEQERRGESGFTFEAPEDYVGETETRSFDPLGRSKVWGVTPGGTHFMSAGGAAYVFLVPSLTGQPSEFDVVLCSKLAYARDGVQPWARGTEHRELSFELALGYAEELAEEVGGAGTKTLTGRKSAWRRQMPEVDGAQMRYGKRLGVYRDGMTKGELSEAIDAHSAAARLDPLVRAVTGR